MSHLMKSVLSKTLTYQSISISHRLILEKSCELSLQHRVKISCLFQLLHNFSSEKKMAVMGTDGISAAFFYVSIIYVICESSMTNSFHDKIYNQFIYYLQIRPMFPVQHRWMFFTMWKAGWF